MKILGHTVTEEQKEQVRSRMRERPFTLCEIATFMESMGFPHVGDVSVTLADCLIQREAGAGNVILWTLSQWTWANKPDGAHV